MIEMTKTDSDREPEIKRLIERIQVSWRKTAAMMLECGENLEKLKALTSRAQFLNELKAIGMSEQTAMRILKCWRRWGSNPSQAVLSTDPAVLYVVAASTDERGDLLANGEKVPIGGQKRQLTELTVAEAQQLKKSQTRSGAKNSSEKGFEKFQFHRDLATLCEEAIDEFSYFIEAAKNKSVIEEKELLFIYVEETASCLNQLLKVLQ